MAFFAIVASDKPGALDLRTALRPEHLAYLTAHAHMLKVAGPFLDADGQMDGSLLIVEADSIEEVQAFAADEPFAKGGLFESLVIRPWRLTLGAFG